VVFHLFATLFLGFTVAVILQTIHEAKKVSSDSIVGAFSGYLLTGAAFGHVYCILEALTPGSFRGMEGLPGQLADREVGRSLLNYFSFVTLTTVGYGDITPATPTARALACLEAVTGQFYIAVVMAELIGLKIAQPRGDQRSDSD
jgi:hypothetical protein